MGERVTPLGKPHPTHGFIGRMGKRKRACIAHPDVLAHEDEKTPREKERVFVRAKETLHPVHRRVRIAAAHAFDPRAAKLRKFERAPRQRRLREKAAHRCSRHLRMVCRRDDHQFKNRERTSCITSGREHDRVKGAAVDGHKAFHVVAQLRVERTFKKRMKRARHHGLETHDAATRSQRRRHRTTNRLRRCPDQMKETTLHLGQKRVLLRLAKAMNFIDEKQGSTRLFVPPAPRFIEDRTQVGDSGVGRVDASKGETKGLGEELRDRRFSRTGRPRENERCGLLTRHETPDDAVRTEHTLLPHDVFEATRTHSLGQRRLCPLRFGSNACEEVAHELRETSFSPRVQVLALHTQRSDPETRPRARVWVRFRAMPTSAPRFKAATHLANVRYEIRGPLARRAQEIERQGHEVLKLNIGNPAAFGFRTPETMRLALVENLAASEGYAHQKGIFPAREAVVMETQSRGIKGITAEDVFMGNGVSELILMTLEAMLEPGDEVLVPSPDYPLWTAAVHITGATPVHYPCRPENAFIPDPEEVRRMVTPKTKALVLINPNNPTGAVYPRPVVEALVRIAEEFKIILLSDEIYDRITYDGAEHVPVATLCQGTLCGTFGGLSKVYRACGLRVGWVSWSGDKEGAHEYLTAVELLASLRLCSNVPGQWAVQTALGGVQSIYELTAPAGRLGRQRKAVLDAVKRSKFLDLVEPKGALYGFVRVKDEHLPGFDDQTFAMALLEDKHVLVVPGSSFNAPYRNHFRVTLLPDEETMGVVFGRIEELLARWHEQGVPVAKVAE